MSINISQHLTWPQLFKYVAPSIAMMIFTSIYGIVDGFFVSNFAGKTALAAVNFIMPVATILATVGFMIGTGGSALVSKTRGEGDERRAKRYFSLLVYTAATIGILLAISGFVFIPTLAQAMSAQGQMLSDSIVYGRMMMITLPFFVLQYVFQSFFVAAGKPQVGFFVILGAGVANILLDALLVGAFGWGLEGAALATNISQLIGGGAGLIYFARKNSSFLQLGSCSFEIRVLGRACLNGSSEMMSNVAASLVAILYNVQLMHYLGEEGGRGIWSDHVCCDDLRSGFHGVFHGVSSAYELSARSRQHKRNAQSIEERLGIHRSLGHCHVCPCADLGETYRFGVRWIRPWIDSAYCGSV